MLVHDARGYSLGFNKANSWSVDVEVQNCVDLDCNNFSVMCFRMSQTELRSMHAKITEFLEGME
ncbi:hypothetical protein UFOVP150_48 [uncultured Caudovirales phage]|uniref:Uncharacterized protein n=1 Tax=uncultured Caudovirales phage TaxID=2100421 RepID=A0A6J7W6V8_9CAUD|nr:hypothetical protein UFOVP150_48 [uncultured Caudovirales phage]